MSGPSTGKSAWPVRTAQRIALPFSVNQQISDAVMNSTANKLSNYKSVGFRPGKRLRAELERLAQELSTPDSSVTISDILRDGVNAYWSHIRAFMRAKARHKGIPDEVVNRIVASGIRAHLLGLNPRDIDHALGHALTQKTIRWPGPATDQARAVGYEVSGTRRGGRDGSPR